MEFPVWSCDILRKDEVGTKLAGVGKAEVGQAGKIGNLKSTKMKN